MIETKRAAFAAPKSNCKQTLTLAELNIGECAKIVGMLPGDKPLRHRLLAMGLLPGTTLQLKRIAPLGCPVEILVRGTQLSIRKGEACLLQLERLNP